MRILYFGWVRSKIGTGTQDIEVPNAAKNVRDLINHLSSLDNTYEQVFRDLTVIRVAVNQEMADMETLIEDAKEIALFPPMTGG
ncbi:MAG: molybdopterin converting factor subunit 1 [Rhodospirillaceae bacterium]